MASRSAPATARPRRQRDLAPRSTPTQAMALALLICFVAVSCTLSVNGELGGNASSAGTARDASSELSATQDAGTDLSSGDDGSDASGGAAAWGGFAGSAGMGGGGNGGIGGEAGQGGAAGFAGLAGTVDPGGAAGYAGTALGGEAGAAGTLAQGGAAGSAGTLAQGGSAGTAGTTVQGGAAGSAGTLAQGGSAGTVQGGAAGSAGTVAQGGAAGTAGNAGSAGAGPPLFWDGFENGLGNWSEGKGTASTSTTQHHSGTGSYIVDGDMDVVYRTFPMLYSKVAVVWLWDNPADTTMACLARVDAGFWNDGASFRALGIDTNIATNRYVYRVGITTTATSVTRAPGWHQLVWDYRSGTNVDLYIDGVLVASPGGVSFNAIALGDWWQDGKAGINYFDDITIQDNLP